MMEKSSYIAENLQKLKLKIKLAELESEKANPIDEVKNLRADSQRLKFKTWDEIEQFVRENCGSDNSGCIPLELAEETLIVPREEFKPELN